MRFKEWLRTRAAAWTLCTVLVAPIAAGCGSGPDNRSGANLPPIDDTRSGRAQTWDPSSTRNQAPQQQQRTGMSTGQKVAVLAGAAALYYMYKKNQEKRQAGNTAEPQYYLSKNGRVYYRDNTGRAHYVTPPQGGIRVPEEEAYMYRDMQGYNNNRQGRSLLDMVGQGNGGF